MKVYKDEELEIKDMSTGGMLIVVGVGICFFGTMIGIIVLIAKLVA